MVQCLDDKGVGRIDFGIINNPGEIMYLGKEQIHNPGYSKIEKCYILLFGMPIIGLRIRARNIFALIPSSHEYRNILDAGSGTGVYRGVFF
jgi:hypothetical protein